MRVALFFDGKNHMKDLRRTTQDRWLDHGALADWVVRHVGGTRMVGAWYYTGVPSVHEARQDGDNGYERNALNDLLDELERRPGFFVRRFNRRPASRDCPHCRAPITYTEEKMVDTSLVVDLVLMATRDAFDAAVVFSGDLDVAPALTAIRGLGKPVWIATFGDVGLSRSLVREAWSHIDLLHHLEIFAHPTLEMPTTGPVSGPIVHRKRETPAGAPERATRTAIAPTIELGPADPPSGPIPGSAGASRPVDTDELDQQVLRELARAQAHFEAGGGFVGAHYFIHRWKSHGIPDSPEARRSSLQRLMQQGRAETYTVDGKTAVRVAAGPTRPRAAAGADLKAQGVASAALGLNDDETDTLGSAHDEDETTVEMRLSETLVRRLRARLDDAQ